jgi:catechol 2,3-dioxygenase-like lactoylglutathione lyase family enzyme
MTVLRDLVKDAIVDCPNRHSILTPYVISHGTLECRNLYRSRKFYQDFLGLECVVHSPSSLVIRCGIKFYITAVEVGDALQPAQILNHWGLDVGSREEVEASHKAVTQHKDSWGLLDVKAPVDRHGVFSFYFQDFDTNWWEIQHYPGYIHDDLFEFGDRFELTPPAPA